MARLTYAQVRSQATAYVRERLENNRLVYALIYKDSGGNFKMHELHDGAVICYTSFKSIVFADGVSHEIRTLSSREDIALTLEQFKNTKFVYAKF